MFARPQYLGVLAAAASRNGSRTGRLGQAPAASLPGDRLRMRLVIALSGPPQRAAAGQERLTEAVKRRADEVLMALRGGIGIRKVCNWLQTQQRDTVLRILHLPPPRLSTGSGVARTWLVPGLYHACTSHVPGLLLACSWLATRMYLACTGLWGGFKLAWMWLWGSYPLAINKL